MPVSDELKRLVKDFGDRIGIDPGVFRYQPKSRFRNGPCNAFKNSILEKTPNKIIYRSDTMEAR